DVVSETLYLRRGIWDAVSGTWYLGRGIRDVLSRYYGHHQFRRSTSTFVDGVGRFPSQGHVRPAVACDDRVGVGDFQAYAMTGLEYVADRPDLDRELVYRARFQRLGGQMGVIRLRRSRACRINRTV